MQYHVYHTLSVETVTGLSRFKGRGSKAAKMGKSVWNLKYF